MEKLQTIIFFIRHGQTDFNAHGDEVRDRERTLTSVGREEVLKVGEYLKPFGVAAIFAGPLWRTMETAEIVRTAAEITGEVQPKNELFEIYHRFDPNRYPDSEAKILKFLQELVKEFAGKQVICVSHQVPIEETLKVLGFTDEEIAAPCRMAEGYRVVFADQTPVECQKVNPARVR